jgi:hypothetical protein
MLITVLIERLIYVCRWEAGAAVCDDDGVQAESRPVIRRYQPISQSEPHLDVRAAKKCHDSGQTCPNRA